MELQQYKFETFVALPDEDRIFYQSIGLLLKADTAHTQAHPEYEWRNFRQWEWGKVKEAQWLFSQPDINYDQLIEGLAVILKTPDVHIETKKTWLKGESWINVFKFYNFVQDSLKEVTKMEVNFLSYEAEDANIQEAVEPLNKYGHFATLHALTKGDMTKFEEWERMTYMNVFTFLRYEKEKAEVDKKIFNILNKQR